MSSTADKFSFCLVHNMNGHIVQKELEYLGENERIIKRNFHIIWKATVIQIWYVLQVYSASSVILSHHHDYIRNSVLMKVNQIVSILKNVRQFRSVRNIKHFCFEGLSFILILKIFCHTKIHLSNVDETFCITRKKSLHFMMLFPCLYLKQLVGFTYKSM